jgi:hypothetical protein
MDTQNSPPVSDDLGADLIWNAQGIAKELRLPLRRVLHLIDRKVLPTGKIGGRIVASRKRLRAFVENAVSG